MLKRIEPKVWVQLGIGIGIVLAVIIDFIKGM